MYAIGRASIPRCSRLGNVPNLAGQKVYYLISSLTAYKAGERKSQMMSGVVKSLSDEDMANVAAYYAAIKITVEVPQ